MSRLLKFRGLCLSAPALDKVCLASWPRAQGLAVRSRPDSHRELSGLAFGRVLAYFVRQAVFQPGQTCALVKNKAPNI